MHPPVSEHPTTGPSSTRMPDAELLRHHGDEEVGAGMLDFAVNVARERPPEWLRRRLIGQLDLLAAYPNRQHEADARTAVAARHGRRPDEVALLSGAAEGFALLPALRPRLAALVHPSFTEPDVALTGAGVAIHRVLLEADDPHGPYALRPERVPEQADLVVLGNPTNPTSRLHPAEQLSALLRPGRVVVVDEAFADAVPGEPQSLAADRSEGLLVLRSLTKTWGLAGLRAGYALGSPGLLQRLTAHRPPWPLSSLAIEAVLACSEPQACRQAAEQAAQLGTMREHMLAALRGLPGLAVSAPAAAPFLLLRVPGGEAVRTGLRRRGIAVRRADTFPGLGPDHLRVAVRGAADTARLVEAMAGVLEERA